MTIKEALDNIVTSGINLGAGDFVDPEALEVAARVLEKMQLEGESCGGYRDVDAERLAGAVEAWSASHPRKTRQCVFLEQWPEAEIDNLGILMVCPKRVSTDCRNRYGNCSKRLCYDCRREFWSQEVE